MKKFIKASAVAFCVLALMTTSQSAYAKGFNLSYNGIPVTSTVSSEIVNDRLLVPLRAIADAMGCQTNYDSATKQITVKKSETVVTMWQGTSKASVNGETVFMDTMPITKSGTVLVPVR
ncbi:MAG: copper amine oxidase N-terminal domain-containing protein, partial [Epulopiscium sp.]|nr:copper amine oxidase N-terminal domain-containing protein [Candidatus Epulonipiscium sp.]